MDRWQSYVVNNGDFIVIWCSRWDEVKCVEMEAFGARASVLDLFDLVNQLADDIHSNLLDLLIVLLHRVQTCHEGIWYLGMTELGRPLDHLVVLNGHQPWYDGDVLEGTAWVLSQGLLKLFICTDVKEELSYYKVGAGLRFLHQIWQVMLQTLVGWMALLGVALRIGGNTDAKVVSVVQLYVSDQINCPGEFVDVSLRVVGNGVLPRTRRVTPERQDIPDTQGFGILQRFVNQLSAHVRASKMQTCGQSKFSLADLCQLQRLLGG
ncbi:hypothetical protein PoMZ_01942 [Pyricularia oryzae]|uniref:Uncharacterized protein n=1 Tax=Pyricularia oryzae TaxID=318829 RepID=A0A4P7N3U4_PYROR|nr:hypothetical protein PoMZ_01942 [Pyricularia oryzae]